MLDPAGKPLPGARVWLRNWDADKQAQSDGSVREVLSNREGRYRHVDVEPGSHYVMLAEAPQDAAAGFAAMREHFDVKPAERVVRDLQAPAK